MLLIALVVYVVLMVVWPLFGSYIVWDATRPYALGQVFIPWILFLILGLVAFGALGPVGGNVLPPAQPSYYPR